MNIKEKLKQIKCKFKVKFKVIRLLIKNWFVIPKGIRRMLIELTLVIGQLTQLYLIDSDDEKANELFDDILSIYSLKMDKIKEYVNFIKEKK